MTTLVSFYKIVAANPFLEFLKTTKKIVKADQCSVLKERRNEVFLCSKFGAVMSPNGEFKGISSTPEYVHQACENSLKILYLIRSLKILLAF
ncbi:aldo/keto reductase [Rhizophagus irregularis DAOM 181602=DAOM 197198]|nr:aldo/keto reductase [Rhizophagus irregularis DAOM 181602=DAOM 197198]